MGLLGLLSRVIERGRGRDPDATAGGDDATRARADDAQPDDEPAGRAFDRDEIREAATTFASEHDGFDFGVASLQRLDAVAERQAGVIDALGEDVGADNELVAVMRERYTLWFGSYFGEVLVRQCDGEWVRDDDGAASVAVPTGAARPVLPVFDLAAAAVDGDPRFAALASDVTEAERDDGAAPETRGAAAREAARRLVDSWPAHDLDYTPGSLERLDRLVDERLRTAAVVDAADDDAVRAGLVESLGSYLGEVLVRTHDAEWVDDDGVVVEIRPLDDGGATTTVDVFRVASDCLAGPSRFAAAYETATRAAAGADDA